MLKMKKTHVAFKVWLETEDGYVFGPGVYSLLLSIKEKGTLRDSAKDLGMSYRYAWGLIKKAEDTLGEPLIAAFKGGSHGGGGTVLTETAQFLLKEFRNLRERVSVLAEAEEKYNAIVKSVDLENGEVDLLLTNVPLFELKTGDRVAIFHT